jgi:hypothetical protein
MHQIRAQETCSCIACHRGRRTRSAKHGSQLMMEHNRGDIAPKTAAPRCAKRQTPIGDLLSGLSGSFQSDLEKTQSFTRTVALHDQGRGLSTIVILSGIGAPVNRYESKHDVMTTYLDTG